MEQEIHNTIKEIKKSLRLSMNGVVSTLQRRQGLEYKINFGVELPRIKEIASIYEKEYTLAQELWTQDIRECRILAILLMPAEEFNAEDAQQWISQTRNTEIADLLSMHLLCNIPEALKHALNWTQSDNETQAYCGFMTLAHLYRKGEKPDAEQEEQYLLHTKRIADNCDISNTLRRSALTSLAKYEALNERHDTATTKNHM